MSQELLEYIKNCQAQGQSQSVIEANLLTTGWTKDQIDQAFQQLVTKTEGSKEGEAPKPQDPQTNQSSEAKHPTSKLVSFLTLVGFGFASVLILSPFAVKAGFLNGLAWACGDVRCTTLDSIFIFVVLISWFFTFSLPGIFLYAFLRRSWKLPIIFLALSSMPVILTLVKNPSDVLNLQLRIARSGLVLLLFSGEAQLIMLLIFLFSLIPILIKPLLKLSRFIKPILVFEGLIFSLFIIISVVFPKLLVQAERGISNISSGSPTNPPIGTIFYTGPDYNKPLFYSISSTGDKKEYKIPSGCHVTDIADDKNTALCFVGNSDSNNDHWYLLSLKNNTNKQIEFGKAFVVSNLKAKLTPDGKTVYYFDYDISDRNPTYSPKIGKFDLETNEDKVFFDAGQNYAIDNFSISKDSSVITFMQIEKNLVSSASLVWKLVVIDNSGQIISEIPNMPYCMDLQLSNDNSHVFCWFEKSFFLVDLKNKQINKMTVPSTGSGVDYISNETGAMEKGKAVLYDGKDSVYFHYENSIKKMNLTDQNLETVFDQFIEAIFMNGRYGATRIREASSYVTYIYDFSNNKKLKLLNNDEFIFDWKE